MMKDRGASLGFLFEKIFFKKSKKISEKVLTNGFKCDKMIVSKDKKHKT